MYIWTWFEPRTTLEVVRDLFPQAREVLRLASAYFTLRGWSLIRHYIQSPVVYLMVGLEERERQNARQVILQEIIDDLQRGGIWERRATALDLMQKLQQRSIRIFDARAIEHHAKIFIIDNRYAIIGSANLTGWGLQTQIEAGGILADSKEIEARIADFDKYFAEAEDISEVLLEFLSGWLTLVSPWHAYLRVLYLLSQEIDFSYLPPNYDKSPSAYQRDIIVQVLRQILDHRGAMLVASTGLGKTIIGLHVAWYLFYQRLIQRVLIVSPAAVADVWRREFRRCGIPYFHVVTSVLYWENRSDCQMLQDFLELCDDPLTFQQEWLVIIDESQDFRHRHLAYARLLDFIQSTKARVLLLSGSPYGKAISDLNNQLYLLPHTYPVSRNLFSSGPLAERDWQIPHEDENQSNIISTFVNWPVVCQLTTAYVASRYGKRDDQGLYVEYGSQKRYIPDITLNMIEYHLFFAEDLYEILEGEYMLINCSKINNLPNFWGMYNLEKKLQISWVSSPRALENFLLCVLDTPGGPRAFPFSKDKKKPFLDRKHRAEERIAICKRVLGKVRKMSIDKDEKFKKLLSVLDYHLTRGEKAIVFVERYATAVYLMEQLQKLRPDYRCISMVEKTEDEEYRPLPRRRVMKDIERFAPIANSKDIPLEEQADIFLTTDAYGVGINLQDAAAAIYYDLSWTAIPPAQRAGRILRFWIKPRMIYLYSFVPKEVLSQRWTNLCQRHDISQQITQIPTLPDKSEHFYLTQLETESEPIQWRSQKLDLEEIVAHEIQCNSQYFEHIKNLHGYEEQVKHIKGDIVTIKRYDGDQSHLVLLVRIGERLRLLSYLIRGSSEPDREDLSDIGILNLIASKPEEPVVEDVDLLWLEGMTQKAIEDIAKGYKVPVDSIILECTIYLVGEGQKNRCVIPRSDQGI